MKTNIGKNILAIRNDRFGEFLLNIPAFKALKANFPGSRLSLAVAPYVKQLAGCIECVDETIEWDNKKHSPADIFKFSNFLKKRRFDVCVIFNPSRDSNLVSFLAGIPVRLGYDRKWAFLLTHKIPDSKSEGYRHEVDSNLALLSKIGVSAADKKISIRVFGEDKKFIDELLEKQGVSFEGQVLVLHPWTSDPLKQWPADKFSGLARKLLAEYDFRIVVIGGSDEIEQSREFCQNNPGLINLAGQLSLPQLAAFLARAKLLVSNDSGPVHLASAVNTSVLAIFRDDIPGKSPRRWGPWSDNGYVISKDSLDKITVDEVSDRIRQIIQKLK